MIWLASFPRSGNTFFRNVLHDVYGIESSTYHQDPTREADPDFASKPVVKTHLLPGRLPEQYRDSPAVYLVRDGRDALVSIAHHRKDIVAPGTGFYYNLLEATLAQGGSFFGGWSENVRQWSQKAAIVIRFEDLIKDPIQEVEKLREIMDLPPPDYSKLPTFKSLREGRPAYGGGSGKRFDPERLKKHFRSGKIGGWRTEVPPELLRLMIKINRPTLEQLGYLPPTEPAPSKKIRRVLIEGSKLLSPDNDGVKRYLVGLRQGLFVLVHHFPSLEVSMMDHFGTVKISKQQPAKDQSFNAMTDKEVILKDDRIMDYEKWLLLLKQGLKDKMPTSWYDKMARIYRKGPARTYLSRMKLTIQLAVGRLTGTSATKALATADLVHIPLPQHVNEFDLTGKNLLVTAHDFSHRRLPDFHEAANIQRSEQGMQSALAAKANFIAVSEATRDDLVDIYQVSLSQIHPIPEALDTAIFRQETDTSLQDSVLQRYHIPAATPYLMCLSTIEPRKNLGNTIRAFFKLKERYPDLEANLVICGKHGWKTEDVFAGLDLNRPDLIFTGFVDDAHLSSLYTCARALCYVSHYEGFGLPILEAMACRTPVIYGNNSSMPEVGGDGGIAVAANDPAAIADAMHQLLTDDALHQQKSDAAWRQANRFSWLKTALLTLDLYERLTQDTA